VIAVGLMSGTSLDGIDAALLRIAPSGARYAVELLKFVTLPFDDDLASMLRSAVPPNRGSTELVADLHHRIGAAFVDAARAACGNERIGFIASHGQTVWHDGDRSITLQIGDPFLLREALRATVCYDFRSADCAAGGHGAPLVPYVDALLLGSDDEDRIAVNVGGIANLTALPRGCDPNAVLAFDTGPGVMNLDAFVRMRTDGALAMDTGGAFAMAGHPQDRVLEAMLDDAYFKLDPPKTTGRERFGAGFLERHRDALAALSLEDGCATLAELTAATIAQGIRACGLENARVLCSGGGIHHRALMRSLQKRLDPARVETTQAMGLPSDAKEAIAFAVLGYETLRERAANSPRATGAVRAVPLGAIAPYGLRELLAGIDRECSSS
jgi:anhydro-N-acetylmuramic acid kinase